jgi:hypothetical protein
VDDNSLQSQEDTEVDGDEIEMIATVDVSEGILADSISLLRFQCIAHTLQLVLKEVEHNVAYTKLLSKAR